MTKKNISLIIVLAAIVGVIWYIESTKARPSTPRNGGTPQVISLGSGITSGQTPRSSTGISETIASLAAADKKAGYAPAIEIADPTGFINASSSFRLTDLIGKKVILLDFWTYSCINCIRTLPYLTSWYRRYKDQGLEIVGIHTPEFDFEKNIDNVKAAVEKFSITYPVILDSNYGTWTAYGNRYWPHEYLIDMAGYVVHDQIGEGNYDGTEREIQKLLAERSTILGAKAGPMPSSTVSVPGSAIAGGALSPETYFGASRNEYLGNGARGVSGDQNLSAPAKQDINNLYLVGSWNFQPEYAKNNGAGARVIYRYNAAKVYFVASAPSGATIEIIQDGKPVSAAAGSDVKNSKATIGGSRLYNVIMNPDGAGEHILEIIINAPGLEAYTFTFG